MGGNCLLSFLWITVLLWARSAKATRAKGEQMLAVQLVRWERCCLEWLLSELFFIWFCSFIQQVANTNSISIPGSRTPLTGQVLLWGEYAKTRTLASSFGECSPCRRQHFRNALLFHISYWLVWASQHLVYQQLSISPFSKLKLALQILLFETGAEVGGVVYHMSQHLSPFVWAIFKLYSSYIHHFPQTHTHIFRR